MKADKHKARGVRLLVDPKQTDVLSVVSDARGHETAPVFPHVTVTTPSGTPGTSSAEQFAF